MAKTCYHWYISARSTDRGMVRERTTTGRPKGRSRSLPRRKPSKAIADRASVFSNHSGEQPVRALRREAEQVIKPVVSKPVQSSHRRSASPRPVTQKVRLCLDGNPLTKRFTSIYKSW